MRVVIQRVEKASVEIDGHEHCSIDKGMLILTGIEDTDTQEDVNWLAGKIARLRIFDDANGVMNLAVTETGGGILVVSQFTLHASTKKGNRPSYFRASGPERAVPVYESFLKQLEKESGIMVKSGIFGAMMKVALVNDGPVTIIIDSKAKE
ncbi:MAG: D-aminoacyl-tRNA deacylase [Bacteroides sp.]|jgi:D-tyrosyl-tRNA(Tyr) deacylase|nr:D-aminoacyl-tRNA deacylase [Bacteroides sp.]